MTLQRDKLVDENEDDEEDEVTSGKPSVINEETKQPIFADNHSSVQFVAESRPESKTLMNGEDEMGLPRQLISMKPSIKEPTSHESSKVILNFQKSICSAKDSFGTKKSVMTNPKETESLSKDLKIKTSSLK